MDLKWSVGVSYTDLDNRRLFASYTVNARNRDTAEDIGKELFLMEYGVQNSIDFMVEPEHLTADDLRTIMNIRDTLYPQLDKTFCNKTYKEFTLAYQQFDGFSAHLSTFDDSFFWLNFMGLTAKAVFMLDGECYIDTKEIYYSKEVGKKIVARNHWSEFYYCV